MEKRPICPRYALFFRKLKGGIIITVGRGRRGCLAEERRAREIVLLANSDLADIVGIAHLPSIPADRRVIGIARLHAVCFSNPGGVAAEIIGLRHPLGVMQRSVKKPK